MNNNKPSVLLVDDNRYNIMILEEYLADYDYELSIASDGEQAMSLLEHSPQRYQVLLLDWNMPKLDGLEVLKRIKADPHLKHIFVIMQTTNAMDDQIQKAMDAGADDYVTKPYIEEEIHRHVENAVQEINKNR